MTDEQSIRDEVIDLIENAQEHARRNGFVATPAILADALLASPVILHIQEEAWDEGMAYGVNYDAGDYEVAPEPIENPYRKEGLENERD